MHQLKALIWKAYKVRIRSPLATALDVAGPIVIISIYILLKISLGFLSSPSTTPDQNSEQLFRLSTSNQVELLQPRVDLTRYTCTKYLYFSPLSDRQYNPTEISRQCGIELIRAKSRDDIISKLSHDLALRMEYRPAKREDLRWSNASRSADGCFFLPGRNEPLYQVGIVLSSAGGLLNLEVHSTDSAGHRVIYQPYTQGSNYNEYRSPQSDLNSGLHLIETCFRAALFHALISTQHHFASDNSTTSFNHSDLPIRLRAFPVIAASQVTPMLFLIFQLLANLCNGAATIMRISEDNETGLRHYIRLTGVPAIYYWTSQLITIMVHMSLQSLLMAVILSWPTNSNLLDPIAEANITLRWLLLLTYGLAINVYGLFIGSLFYKTSQALLVTCLLAVSYAMYPLTFMVQWSPYKFSPYKTVINLMLANPVSNYEALLTVLYAVQLQSADSLSWSHLSSRIIGGGMSDWSASQLWLLLILQAVFWFIATVLIDQILYCSSLWPTGLLISLLDLIGFGSMMEPKKQDQLIKSTKSAKTFKSLLQANKCPKPLKPDPNRVCCSLRDVSVLGQSVLSAFTVDQTSTNVNKGKQPSKQPYLPGEVDTSVDKEKPKHKDSKLTMSLQDESILIDFALDHKIERHKTRDRLVNINMDFRLNQVSFILGSASLKELFFSALLGLRTIQSGHLILDERKYSPSSLFMARRHIGYLGERDIFLNEMSIFENLQLFGSLRDPSYNEYDSESSFLLNLLHLSKRRAHLPASLTYRSARKLALAVAAVGHTKLLLLVEPTLNLHWRPRCQVLNLLKKYKSIRSIVVDTSDVDEAATFGDRIILLNSDQADLDGPPAALDKMMNCGYWLLFEPESSMSAILRRHNELEEQLVERRQTHNRSPRRETSLDNISALETLTSEVFKQDKIDQLDATRQYLRREPLNTTKGSDTRVDLDKDRGKQHPSFRIVCGHNNTSSRDPPAPTSSTQTDTTSDASGGGLESRLIRQFAFPRVGVAKVAANRVGRKSKMMESQLNDDGQMHRSGILLKVRHSNRVHQSLCTILSMFQKNGGVIHGFRLAQLSYESLEDVLVVRMSKAVYPNLPADMLISLQLRAKAYKLSQRQKTNHSATNSQPNIHSPFPLSNLVTSAKQQPERIVRMRKDSDEPHVTNEQPLFTDRPVAIVKDRLSPANEILTLILAFILSLTCVYIALWAVHRSLMAENVAAGTQQQPVSTFSSPTWSKNNLSRQITQTEPVDYGAVNELYKHRVGFYVIAESNNVDTQASNHLSRWPASPKLTGLIKPDLRDSDALFVSKAIHSSKDQVAIMLFLEPKSGLISVLFEPHLAHSMLAGLKAALNYRHLLLLPSGDNSSSSSDKQDLQSIEQLNTSRFHFLHSWHEIIVGYKNRRFFYALGFAIAEGIVIGSLVVAPIRHRRDLHVNNFHTTYWISMGLFDLILSLLLVTGYTALIAYMEDISSLYSIVVIILTLALYKFSALPVAYLVSLIADTTWTAFWFILLTYATIGWSFSAHLMSFIEWILYNEGYLYTVAKWATLVFPISSMIESLTNTVHIARIDKLCPSIPAFTPTVALSALDGVQKNSITDELLYKVDECLENGKMGISTDMLHQRKFGILWYICLIAVFGIVTWVFLLFSEHVLGIIAHRFSSRNSKGPIKTLIRSTEPSQSLLKWDRERDRLVSEYIRCLNEKDYVKLMSRNCLYLRLWFRPMSAQTSLDKQLASFLEPLIQLGQPRSDLQIELKTTLQLFIRIGCEKSSCKIGKVKLIETYAQFVKQNSHSLVKFAVVDWSCESLYRILLHGYYNTNTAAAS